MEEWLQSLLDEYFYKITLSETEEFWSEKEFIQNYLKDNPPPITNQLKLAIESLQLISTKAHEEGWSKSIARKTLEKIETVNSPPPSGGGFLL